MLYPFFTRKETPDMKPVIAVTPLWDDAKQSQWMLPGYLQGLLNAGAVPMVLPLTEDKEVLSRLLARCDGLLLTGGQDVAPALYGEVLMACCGETCPQLDGMERHLLRLALEWDLPIFGICRGLQFLNVYLGGTLYQDLPSQRLTPYQHHQEPPYERPAHPLFLEEGGLLHSLLEVDTLAVNSCHHQGAKVLAPALRLEARSEDGLVEAVSLPGHTFVLGVQWHPELMLADPSSIALFSGFAHACCHRRETIPLPSQIVRSAL